jgi:hypothetical protein
MVKTGSRLIRIKPNSPKELEYSEDGGNCWNYLNVQVDGAEIFELTSQNNEIIAATSNGIYYSNDGYGNYWSRR